MESEFLESRVGGGEAAARDAPVFAGDLQEGFGGVRGRQDRGDGCGEVEAGDVEIATDAALGEAVATTAGGEAATDLSMPAPVAAPGKARGPRDDRDFGGWVS